MMRVLILGTALAFAGCAEPPEIVMRCPGEQPALDDCFRGNYFAECGGTGRPLFACGAHGDCRWFVDGCVAKGYVVSTCPVDDLCCHDDFPFTQDQMSDEEAYWAGKMLTASGTRPWNRTAHMDVTVAVDPGLVAQPPDLVCVGDTYFEADSGPCGMDTITAALGDMMFLRTYSGGFAGVDIQIEIDVTAAEGLRARACLAWYSDLDAGRHCPSRDVECAVEGMIVVNQLDSADGLHGALDLTMASGDRLSGTFMN